MCPGPSRRCERCSSTTRPPRQRDDLPLPAARRLRRAARTRPRGAVLSARKRTSPRRNTSHSPTRMRRLAPSPVHRVPMRRTRSAAQVHPRRRHPPLRPRQSRPRSVRRSAPWSLCRRWWSRRHRLLADGHRTAGCVAAHARAGFLHRPAASPFSGWLDPSLRLLPPPLAPFLRIRSRCARRVAWQTPPQLGGGAGDTPHAGVRRPRRSARALCARRARDRQHVQFDARGGGLPMAAGGAARAAVRV